MEEAAAALRCGAAREAPQRQRAALRLELALFAYLLLMGGCQHWQAHRGRLHRIEVASALLTIGCCARRLIARAVWRSAARRAAEEALDAVVALSPHGRLLRRCCFTREVALAALVALNGSYVLARFASPAPMRRLLLLALPAVAWLLAAQATGPSYARPPPPPSSSSAKCAVDGGRSGSGSGSSGLPPGGVLSYSPQRLAAELAREALACAFGACALPILAALELDELLEPSMAVRLIVEAALCSTLLLAAQATVLTLPELLLRVHDIGAWAFLGTSSRRPADGWALPGGLEGAMPEPWSHGPLGSKGGRGGKADGLRQHGGRARGLHPPESRPFLNRCSSSEKGALPRESRGSSHSKEPGAGCSRSRSPSPVFNGRSSTAAGLAAEPPDSQGSTVRSRTRAASTGPAETAPDARSSTGASSSTARLARPLRTSAEAADAAHPQWSPALVYPRGYVVSFLRSDWMALGGRTRTRPGSAIAALAFFGLCEPDRLPRLLLKAQLALCLLALLDAARHLLGAFAPALTASSLLRLVAYALLVPEVARARTAALLSFGAAAELLQSGMVIGRGH